MKKLTVAEYLETLFAQCGKSQTEIAKQIGYKKPNILSMIKKGGTKLPLDMVGPLAIAIGADPVFLLKLVIAEYMPETYAAIESDLNCMAAYSVQEKRLVQIMRETFLGNQIDLDDPRTEGETRQFMSEIAAKQATSELAARERYKRSPANARDFG